MEQASCAAGCTKMGAVPEIPESYIRGVIGTADGTGTNIANIPSGLQKLGYQGTATYTETATIGNVAQQTAAGNSVIVNVRTPGGDIHAIVVDSISNGTAYIRDPLPMGGSSGGSAYSIPASALQSQMTGKAVVITPPKK
jgi:filamentous hemagglutinin